MFPGETLFVGPDGTNGSSREAFFITALTATQIAGIWQDNHANAAPVTVQGTFPAGVIPPASSTNCLGAQVSAGPPVLYACKELVIQGWNPSAVTAPTLTAAQASTG